jgi:redox-sensitive bicupin YhaK (pirin superfamily)
VFEGSAVIGGRDVAKSQLAVLGQGQTVEIAAGSEPGRLILVAGRPLREPVAKYGPFVMNTAEEIHQAIADYQMGRL